MTLERHDEMRYEVLKCKSGKKFSRAKFIKNFTFLNMVVITCTR